MGRAKPSCWPDSWVDGLGLGHFTGPIGSNGLGCLIESIGLGGSGLGRA